MAESSIESAKIQAFKELQKFPALHLATYIHKTANNVRLNFTNNEWQIAMYACNADKIVIKKASKTGVSEYCAARVFASAKQGLSGMYVLPDQPIRNRFVTSRIDKMVANTPEYQQAIQSGKKDVDSKSLKTIYGKEWAFVGANNPGTFYEFNSDINIYDELNQCNPISLETATDRTLASDRDRWIKVGNPTISGFGVDEAFDISNQCFWHIKCDHCNEWQILNWFEHFVNQEDEHQYSLMDKDIIDGHDALGFCIKCSKKIDRLGYGNWVPVHPDAEVFGFHVTRLFGSISKERHTIIEDFNKMKDCVGNLSLMQWFYNNRLGIEYEADGSKVTEALLAECVQADYLMPSENKESGAVVAGADIGAKIHLTASRILPNGKRQKVAICTLPLELEALEEAIKKYGIDRGVIDALPETKFVKDFIKRNRGWMRNFYSKKDDSNLYISVNHKKKQINVGRTESLDAMLANFVNNDMLLPKNYQSIENGDYVKQMVASTRIYDEDRQVFTWSEGGKPDHFFHAENLENICFDVFFNNKKNVSVS